MEGEFVLFPDAREEDANADEGNRITCDGFAVVDTPDEVLLRLRRIDWAHPALLVYRTEGENRWSTVLLGLNKPEFGEVDA
jgi:hypothetical protein